MPRILGAFVKKIKNPFNKMGFGRKLIYSRKSNKKSEPLVQFFSPDKNGSGQIEIVHGNGPVASLSYQLGKNLPVRLSEIRSKDYYVDSGRMNALRVGEAYKRQGFASQMVAELTSQAKKNRANVYLRVNVANVGAVEFYKASGFKVVRSLGGSEQLMAYYNV
ncbi:MAG: GNAT family N-acetyltransferase [Candidatus ainarchaeum sp.]|nr:GNAT family N-acetyltransferase [Candidatus ainarchaeum sp.]